MHSPRSRSRPPPGTVWKAKFNRPSGVGQPEEVINLLVPANTIVVFVGARELFGDPIETSSSREYFGSVEWGDLVLGRGQADSYGPAATDFSPWGGSISYDLIANWHFGIDPPGNPDEFDLYMATQKALLHILGFGASEAWNVHRRDRAVLRPGGGRRSTGPRSRSAPGTSSGSRTRSPRASGR